MIDIKWLRDHPDAVRASQVARGEDAGLVDAILDADKRRRESLAEFEQRRAEQKATSRDVGAAMGQFQAAKKAGEPADVLARLEGTANAARRFAGELSDRVKSLEAQAAEADTQLGALMRRVGNAIIDGVPAGGEDDFVVLETRGTPRDFAADGFAPRDHLEILEGLGAVDMARGVKVAESRFYYLVGQGARLESALMNLALATAYDNGFTQLAVPTLVNRPTMAGAGFIDAHEEEVYHLDADDLFLTGTSEVALAGFHADEILDLSGGPAARKFDCEAWVPTQEKYREVTSTSNCTTFQARRLGIREKRDGRTEIVATLNGTLATSPRWLVALVENHQNADGSVTVPAALQPYLGVEKLVAGGR